MWLAEKREEEEEHCQLQSILCFTQMQKCFHRQQQSHYYCLISCFYCNIQGCFYALDQKSATFVGKSFLEVSGLFYKQNGQLFYYKGTAPCVPLKIRMFKQSYFSQLLRAFENTPANKNMFIVDDQNRHQNCFS